MKQTTIKQRLTAFGGYLSALPAGFALMYLGNWLVTLGNFDHSALTIIYTLSIILVFVGFFSPVALLPKLAQQIAMVLVSLIFIWMTMKLVEGIMVRTSHDKPAGVRPLISVEWRL